MTINWLFIRSVMQVEGQRICEVKGQHCQSCSNSLNNKFLEKFSNFLKFWFSYLVSQKFLGYCIFGSGAHRTRVSLDKKQKSFWLTRRPLNSFNLAKSLSQHFRWSIKTLEAYWTQIWYSKYHFSVNLHKLGHLCPFGCHKKDIRLPEIICGHFHSRSSSKSVQH